jgi:hypothetical protein
MARAAILPVVLATTASVAIAAAPGAADVPPQALVVVSVGAIDVIDAVTRGFYSVEWRQEGPAWPPSPWFGFETTGHDRFYAFGGLGNVALGGRWRFTYSLGAAIFREHDGLHLGFPLEFRSMGEFSRSVGALRVGVAVGHYSNLELGTTNRGTEFLRAVLAVPLGRGAARAGAERMEPEQPDGFSSR